ncbi:MAG: carbonic anhydrase [Verrucomicrobiaceae bacterium]|nr:MAG: carbonic anhydrase [Verrucomicrobiaceae bacterium]
MPHSTTASVISTMTPADALRRLKEGNVRFLNNLRQHRDPHFDLNLTKEGQWPFAAVVACMDSRVSTEMVFDIGIGDMFSLRIAGNVLTEGIIGSLEYATSVVGSKLIVIMGHSNCGAVKAACDHVELGNLTSLLAQVQPAVQLADPDEDVRNSSNGRFVQSVADLNVLLAAEQLPQRSPVIRDLVRQGKVGIVSAMYDVATGQVRFLEALSPAPAAAPPSHVPVHHTPCYATV